MMKSDNLPVFPNKLVVKNDGLDCPDCHRIVGGYVKHDTVGLVEVSRPYQVRAVGHSAVQAMQYHPQVLLILGPVKEQLGPPAGPLGTATPAWGLGATRGPGEAGNRPHRGEAGRGAIQSCRRQQRP